MFPTTRRAQEIEHNQNSITTLASTDLGNVPFPLCIFLEAEDGTRTEVTNDAAYAATGELACKVLLHLAKSKGALSSLPNITTFLTTDTPALILKKLEPVEGSFSRMESGLGLDPVEDVKRGTAVCWSQGATNDRLGTGPERGGLPEEAGSKENELYISLELAEALRDPEFSQDTLEEQRSYQRFIFTVAYMHELVMWKIDHLLARAKGQRRIFQPSAISPFLVSVTKNALVVPRTWNLPRDTTNTDSHTRYRAGGISSAILFDEPEDDKKTIQAITCAAPWSWVGNHWPLAAPD
ncbi:hypothetical protein C8R43DRAFT_1135884 [Mycena crocata]|nr:hypothetical protein C8R43DRAFT_1135884 [Mycena crocata]